MLKALPKKKEGWGRLICWSNPSQIKAVTAAYNNSEISAASLAQTNGDAKGHFTNKTANRQEKASSLSTFLI
jgi:hypothetical protein